MVVASLTFHQNVVLAHVVTSIGWCSDFTFGIFYLWNSVAQHASLIPFAGYVAWSVSVVWQSPPHDSFRLLIRSSGKIKEEIIFFLKIIFI